MPTPVTVSACDNELYILAIQGSLSAGGWGSTELLHIMSGNNDPVSYTFNLESVLPTGSYTLLLIGIDWGGVWNFSVQIGGTTYAQSGPSSGVSVPWIVTVPVTI
jgi:hypothetical protein